MVLFGATNPLPIEGKDVFTTVIKGFFDHLEVFNVTPLNISYRVIGNTAIVTGICNVTTKPKDGPISVIPERFIEVWVKENGSWRYIASQEDEISIGN